MYRALLCCLLVLLTACASAPTPPPATRGTTATAIPATAPAAPNATTARTNASAAPVAPAPLEREAAQVVRVIDGDTIDVQLAGGRVERVRYIGVDTPETVDPRTTVECYGMEASAHNATLVEGRAVELERDVSERDTYERLLRYVWVVGDDGALRMANEELVKGGYASAVSYPPDVRYGQRFGELERAARDAHLGLWGACNATIAPSAAPVVAPAPTSLSTRAIAAPTRVPTRTPTPASDRQNCHPSYPTLCLPGSPDLDCADIPAKRFPVKPPDPHRLDGDNDGVGCES